MKNPFIPYCLLLLGVCVASISANAQDKKPDTVSAGIYITSIHNIDFKEKEYAVNLWLWLKYKNRDFNFYDNLEVPGAKEVTKSFVTIDSSGDKVYMQMKLQCIMKDSWKIANFPFDKQKLRFSIENSQYDSRSLVFVADTVGDHYDKRFAMNGWTIDSCIVTTGKKAYETAFGDERMKKPHTEYSNFKLRLSVHREAMDMFWKLFLGMYIAFLIAYVCFYIHSDGMDSRFGLSVGALFAVIGNKYIIDSSLPETTSFTLVDTLHGLTLCFIFSVVSSTAWSLQLVKKGKAEQANRFDMIMAQVLLLIYILLNIYFINAAANSQ